MDIRLDAIEALVRQCHVSFEHLKRAYRVKRAEFNQHKRKVTFLLSQLRVIRNQQQLIILGHNVEASSAITLETNRRLEDEIATHNSHRSGEVNGYSLLNPEIGRKPFGN